MNGMAGPSEQASSAWSDYPSTLENIDISLDDITTSKKTLEEVVQTLCAKDESYTELLEFKAAKPANATGDEPEPDVSGSPLALSLLVIPHCLGIDNSHKLSITPDDLKRHLHEWQVSPHMLSALSRQSQPDIRFHYGLDGEHTRIEVWFGIPYPGARLHDLVLWLGLEKRTTEVRGILFGPPSEVLSRARNIKQASGGITGCWQLVLSLLTLTLTAWTEVESKEESEVVMTNYYTTPQLVTGQDLRSQPKHLLDIHQAVFRITVQIRSLEHISNLITFISAHAEVFGGKGDENEPFMKHLKVKASHIMYLLSRAKCIRSLLADTERLVLQYPMVIAAAAAQESKARLTSIPIKTDPINSHMRTGVAAHKRDAARSQPVELHSVLLYVPWIMVTSLASARLIPASVCPGFGLRFSLVLTATTALTAVTYVGLRVGSFFTLSRRSAKASDAPGPEGADTNTHEPETSGQSRERTTSAPMQGGANTAVEGSSDTAKFQSLVLQDLLQTMGEDQAEEAENAGAARPEHSMQLFQEFFDNLAKEPERSES